MKDGDVVVLTAVALAAIALSLQWKNITRVISAVLGRLYLHGVIARRQARPHLASSGKTVVTEVYIYPVKSLRVVPCTQAQLGSKGFVGDRQFMVVTPAPLPLYGEYLDSDPTHRFLTQRQCPSLATVHVERDDQRQQITLSSHLLSKEESVTFSTKPNSSQGPRYRASLWSDLVVVQDMGDLAATFLKKIVALDDETPDELKNGDIRLVTQSPEDGRTADSLYVPHSGQGWLGQMPQVALSDGFPILLASEASLRELNRRLQEKGKEPLPMARFRPNIVVQGNEPFEEDRWRVIRIGKALIHVVKGCPRCKQSCTDQTSGKVTEEPLETLAEFRNTIGKQEYLYFAQNALASPASFGEMISVGDTVEVLQWGEPIWDT